jgi:hypothetical protein
VPAIGTWGGRVSEKLNVPGSTYVGFIRPGWLPTEYVV